tara:strand:+ start:1607 stop:2143 length:537 start_codon:yes stop_codon:yes gene_type:complete
LLHNASVQDIRLSKANTNSEESTVFEALETTAIALWVGESLWGYPIMLGLHVVGLAMVVGLFVMRDLRLIGMLDSISFQSLLSLSKLGWMGFLINVISGCFLFSSQATYFVTHTPFLLKITMIFLATVTAGLIQQRIRVGAEEWDSGSGSFGVVRNLAIVSIALWMGAIIAGRLIAYL